MSLHLQLKARAQSGRPIRVGLIGAGKFGSMYLAQVIRTPGVHLVAIADLNPAMAQLNLARVGWKPEQTQARSLDHAIQSGLTHLSDDWQAMIQHPEVEVIVECTGVFIGLWRSTRHDLRFGRLGENLWFSGSGCGQRSQVVASLL